ncbi:MAG: D-2-hydroxyacid dehydrogenase [Dehalococcoidia bacterium]|nr:D-2-hydroxyacid dehydrogenase [Dehalococcoidia bacterium]
MPTLLVSHSVAERYGASIAEAFPGIETLILPGDSDQPLDDETRARIDYAFFSTDIYPASSRSFFTTVRAAPNLKWIHVMSAGVDNWVFQELLKKGIRMTTSSGSTAKPIAQSVIGGMLMLSRGFLAWGDSQRRHAWEPIRGAATPSDLIGQTMTVVGLGAIGAEIARISAAIGLDVIGVRRSPWREGDPVRELVPPSALLSVAPRTDWLVLACPLTDETRGLVSSEVLSALPKGAHVLNIARGEVADEPALIEALQSGNLGGAYLDVCTKEPLDPASPFWDMPHVIVSPHNSAAALGTTIASPPSTSSRISPAWRRASRWSTR